MSDFSPAGVFTASPLPFPPSFLSFRPTRAIFSSPVPSHTPSGPFLLWSPPENTDLAAADVLYVTSLLPARTQTNETDALAPRRIESHLHRFMPVTGVYF